MFHFIFLNQNDDVDKGNVANINRNKEKNMIDSDVQDEMTEIKDTDVI